MGSLLGGYHCTTGVSQALQSKQRQPKECGSPLSVDHSGQVSSEKSPKLRSGTGKPQSHAASMFPGWAAGKRCP